MEKVGGGSMSLVPGIHAFGAAYRGDRCRLTMGLVPPNGVSTTPVPISPPPQPLLPGGGELHTRAHLPEVFFQCH